MGLWMASVKLLASRHTTASETVMEARVLLGTVCLSSRASVIKARSALTPASGRGAPPQ